MLVSAAVAATAGGERKQSGQGQADSHYLTGAFHGIIPVVVFIDRCKLSLRLACRVGRQIGSKSSIAGHFPAVFFLVALIAADAVMPISAAELSGQATVTSEYIYRGQAVSDGQPALQFGIDYQHDSGLFGGLWASTIDTENRFSRRNKELDSYLGYQYEFGSRLALTGTFIRYTYPGQRGVDYDYYETVFSATVDGRHSLEFGFTRDLYGVGGIGRHWELRSELPLRSAWVMSAGIGRNDLTMYGNASYLHWDAGASARVGWFTTDIRWYDNQEFDFGINGYSAGSRIVVSLSAVF